MPDRFCIVWIIDLIQNNENFEIEFKNPLANPKLPTLVNSTCQSYIKIIIIENMDKTRKVDREKTTPFLLRVKLKNS